MTNETTQPPAAGAVDLTAIAERHMEFANDYGLILAALREYHAATVAPLVADLENERKWSKSLAATISAVYQVTGHIADGNELDSARRLVAERDGWHRVVVDCERILAAEGTADSPLMSNLPVLVRDVVSELVRRRQGCKELVAERDRLLAYSERDGENIKRLLQDNAALATERNAALDSEAKLREALTAINDAAEPIRAAIDADYGRVWASQLVVLVSAIDAALAGEPPVPDSLPELTPEMRARMESMPADTVDRLWREVEQENKTLEAQASTNSAQVSTKLVDATQVTDEERERARRAGVRFCDGASWYVDGGRGVYLRNDGTWKMGTGGEFGNGYYPTRAAAEQALAAEQRRCGVDDPPPDLAEGWRVIRESEYAALRERVAELDGNLTDSREANAALSKQIAEQAETIAFHERMKKSSVRIVEGVYATHQQQFDEQAARIAALESDLAAANAELDSLRAGQARAKTFASFQLPLGWLSFNLIGDVVCLAASSYGGRVTVRPTCQEDHLEITLEPSPHPRPE